MVTMIAVREPIRRAACTQNQFKIFKESAMLICNIKVSTILICTKNFVYNLIVVYFGLVFMVLAVYCIDKWLGVHL